MTTEATRAHTFDGIQEFDNRLPNWWLWTFYGACIFSVFYWIHYHTLGTGDQPMEEYVIEQREAAAILEARIAANPITDESLMKMASEPEFVAAGKAIYLDPANPLKCALCHKDDGSGLVGPNLTDDMWVYGGKPTDIYTSILKGRPGGMPAHEDKGTGFAMKATAYLLSIKNTNLPGKAPEPNAKKEQ
jgi:cytochrome c oxidase cbb3-type subunit 3